MILAEALQAEVTHRGREDKFDLDGVPERKHGHRDNRAPQWQLSPDDENVQDQVARTRSREPHAQA